MGKSRAYMPATYMFVRQKRGNRVEVLKWNRYIPRPFSHLFGDSKLTSIISIKDELARDERLLGKIRNRLPELFQIAEIESSRAGKVGMEVGSLRERVIVAMLIHKFGNQLVESEIPITEAEVDVKVRGVPISIKTLTSRGFAGVKLIWTVDQENAIEFLRSYEPSCDMIFVQIAWENKGGFHYIPLSTQQEVFREIGRDEYIKLPKQGTNPRGVEISGDALKMLSRHEETLRIEIEWKKKDVGYNPIEKWLELWRRE
ncbi:MAG: ThaI family type II restriction endonuclease [Bacteroidota bacterium]